MSDQMFERAVRDWLDDGSDRTPPPAIDAVLLAVKTTPQERALRIPRRFNPMPAYLRLAAVIAIVAVVGVGLMAYINRTPGIGDATPTPTAAPTSTPVPSPTVVATLPPIDTSSWTTYTSDRYGFTVGHPGDWTERPASRDWTEADVLEVLSPGHEAFHGPNDTIRVSAWSVPLERGTTIESLQDVVAWVEDYCAITDSTPCTAITDRGVELCLERRDCHPGLLVPYDDDVQAYFSGGIYDPDAMIVVVVWWGESAPAVAPYGGAQRLLEGFLSTMQVWPASRPLSERT